MDLEFDELKREFLKEAEGKVCEIQAAMGAGFPPEKDALERMIYLAHQLKGAGGSYGFQTISTDGAALESALEKAVQQSTPQLGELVAERLSSLATVIASESKVLADKLNG